VQRYHSDLFIPKEEQRNMQQAFPVFNGAEGGQVHAPIEYIQIKELTEAVRNYGVSANFTVAQVKRLATQAMTPSDWQTVVKAAAPV
jgi:L-asparaginase/Glu-tRNA(Gln) amidotransferase subunit D